MFRRVFVILVLILGIAVASALAISLTKPEPGYYPNTKIYLLGADARLRLQVEDIIGYVLVPDTVTDEAVRHAWSYAVRYSAKTLDVPDYAASAQLLMQRHPSWQAVISTPPAFIFYQSAYAEGDKPD